MSTENVIENVGATANETSAPAKTNARKPSKRIFSAGLGTPESPIRFIVARGAMDAQAALGTPHVRSAATHELKLFWSENNLHDLSNTEIARRFDVTPVTVGKWVERLGSSEYSRGGSRRDTALRLLRAGKPVAAVAREAGLTTAAVYRTAQRFGITYAKVGRGRSHAPRFTPDEFMALAEGKTWEQLAKAVKLKVGTARTYASRQGLTERLRAVMVPGERKVRADKGVPRRNGRGKGRGGKGSSLAVVLRGVDYGAVRLLLQTLTVVDAFKRGAEVPALVEQFGVPEPVVRYWTTWGDQG